MMAYATHTERWRRRLILASIAAAVVSSILLISTFTEDDDYSNLFEYTTEAGRRGLAQYTDPKSISPRLRPAMAVSDGPLSSSSSVVGVAREPADFESVAKDLKQSEDLWLRGKFVLKGPGYHSNSKGRDEQIASAIASVLEHEKRHKEDSTPLTVCGRAANHPLLEYHHECLQFTQDKPVLLLEGLNTRGRTGNRLIMFLHAIQIARDDGIQLGIMQGSWAMKLIPTMWFGLHAEPAGMTWSDWFQEELCIKVFNSQEELDGWNIIYRETGSLFRYKSQLPLGDYMASQMNILRTLYSNYNQGVSNDPNKEPASKDMCSGINEHFGVEGRESAIYTAIHSRHLEGEAGIKLLRKVTRKTGCDDMAALEMRPEYIKSILEPLGMLNYPIVFISDGQDPTVLDRLLADPDIGPMIRTIDKGVWLGGDITLAVMSNVFIGNPASTFSTFIAKSRLALGFGHSELYRAKDPQGNWRTVCGDHCIFDTGMMPYHA